MLKDTLKMITGIKPPTQAFVPSKYARGSGVGWGGGVSI